MRNYCLILSILFFFSLQSLGNTLPSGNFNYTEKGDQRTLKISSRGANTYLIESQVAVGSDKYYAYHALAEESSNQAGVFYASGYLTLKFYYSLGAVHNVLKCEYPIKLLLTSSEDKQNVFIKFTRILKYVPDSINPFDIRCADEMSQSYGELILPYPFARISR